MAGAVMSGGSGWLARPGVWVLAWLSVSAWAGASGAQPAVEAALAPVEQLIGTAACVADADCHTVALGEKACGGPSVYRAWSSRQTDPKALAVAAARYTKAQGAQVKASGLASNCAWVDDPGARCVAAPEPGSAASATLSGKPSGHCELNRNRGAAVR